MPVDSWREKEWLAALVARLAVNMDAVGAHVAETMRARAPKDTGRAAASIGHKTTADRRGITTRVGAGPEGWYLTFHEKGTSKMPAHPWARPAVFGDADEIMRILLR